ncbi:unnamed protein product, partial [Effrenium voratum]
VEVLTLSEAAEDAVMESDRIPGAEPKDRMQWQHALADPPGFFYNFVGPTNYYFLRRSCRCVTCLLCTLILLAVIYLVCQIILPILDLSDRVAGTETGTGTTR